MQVDISPSTPLFGTNQHHSALAKTVFLFSDKHVEHGSVNHVNSKQHEIIKMFDLRLSSMKQIIIPTEHTFVPRVKI